MDEFEPTLRDLCRASVRICALEEKRSDAGLCEPSPGGRSVHKRHGAGESPGRSAACGPDRGRGAVVVACAGRDDVDAGHAARLLVEERNGGRALPRAGYRHERRSQVEPLAAALEGDVFRQRDGAYDLAGGGVERHFPLVVAGGVGLERHPARMHGERVGQRAALAPALPDPGRLEYAAVHAYVPVGSLHARRVAVALHVHDAKGRAVVHGQYSGERTPRHVIALPPTNDAARACAFNRGDGDAVRGGCVAESQSVQVVCGPASLPIDARARGIALAWIVPARQRDLGELRRSAI